MKELPCMHQGLTTVFDAGDTLDHYRLDAPVAHSGMSTLYRATDLRDGRQVALKIPHAEMESDPVLLERFKREQEIGQELDHPGVVKTLDGEERSRLYMVIEWVEGRLLRAILNEQELHGEHKLPVDRSVMITLGICEALDYMHKHGVVHRDLKPENVMVGADDRIKLIDFGIAMKEDARRLTFAGPSPLLGTPDYISPEQVKGQRGDQRSDIYALGAMLYEMLTGQPPFTRAESACGDERAGAGRSQAGAQAEPGDFAAVAGDSLSGDGARPSPPLCNGARDGLGPGTPGATGRGRGWTAARSAPGDDSWGPEDAALCEPCAFAADHLWPDGDTGSAVGAGCHGQRRFDSFNEYLFAGWTLDAFCTRRLQRGRAAA